MAEEKEYLDPADYFSPDTVVPPRGLFREYYYPTVCGAIGVGSAVFANLFAKKPLFSGLQRHVVSGSIGAVFGFVVDRWMQRRAAQRDAVLYNYIVTHPDDFPPIRRKKYAEVLESWVPIR